MDRFSRADLRTLLSNRQTPCLSVLLGTSRGAKQEDNIRWKAQLEAAEELLTAEGNRPTEARELLGPLYEVGNNVPFWKEVSDGVAAFRSPEMFHIFRVPRGFNDRAYPGRVFFVTPLLPLLEGEGHFYLLAFKDRDFRLVEATRDTAQEFDLPRGKTVRGRAAVFQDLGLPQNDSREALQDYYHRLDERMREFLKGESSPLLLAGTAKDREVYRLANTYPHLLAEEVELNPDQLSADGLRDRAWPVLQKHFEQARARDEARYHQFVGTGLTCKDIEGVVADAYQGRLQYLFLALGQEQWGAFDPNTLRVTRHDRRHPGDEELLNLAAFHALKHGGVVHPTDPARMPDHALLAGIKWHQPGERSGKHATPEAARA